MNKIHQSSAVILKSAKSHSDPISYLIYRIFACSNAYDVAPVLLAYSKLAGAPSKDMLSTPILARAWAICEQARDQAPDQFGLSTGPKRTPKGMFTDWASIVPMSDSARAEAYKAREEAGYYKGIRRLSGKTDRVQINPVSENQYPLHW